MGNQPAASHYNGSSSQNTYDALNRLMQLSNPQGRVLTFAYDADGNLASKTDRSGQALWAQKSNLSA